MARKNNGEPKTFAYEEFMAKARKEGRVRNEELSMKVLKPDLSLQARVNHINVDHVRALHDILKNGQPLAPIIVFEIEGPKGKTFKIADGFHRHEVYKREGLSGIPCVVVTGTLQEAIEYAASANQALSLPRTKNDAKKAVFMLLANGWLDRSAQWIARTAGVTNSTVAKHRAEFCAINGCSVPDSVLGSDGFKRTSSTLNNGKPSIRRTSRGGFRTHIGGKDISLGGPRAGQSEVSRRLQRAIDTIPSALNVASPTMNPAGFTKFMSRRGFFVRGSGIIAPIGGFAADDMGIALVAGDSVESTLAGAARALIIAKHMKASRSIVIRCGRTPAQSHAESYLETLGVEFMTPDEFVAAVKADQAVAEAN